LVEAVSKFDYPPELLDVQVLDDSTERTCEVASPASNPRRLGIPMQLLHRSNREGFKAGALEKRPAHRACEFVAIFDADFIPFRIRFSPPHHSLFPESRNGMVQTRWTYLNRDYSLLTQVETILLDGHFVVEHGAAAPAAALSSISWHCRLLARTGNRLRRRLGHDTSPKIPTFPIARSSKAGNFFIFRKSNVPANSRRHERFKAQQARWAKGLMQTEKKSCPSHAFQRALATSAEAFFHLTRNQLPADGFIFRYAAARMNCPLLSRLV